MTYILEQMEYKLSNPGCVLPTIEDNLSFTFQVHVQQTVQ
jgi:hypothetical protein